MSVKITCPCGNQFDADRASRKYCSRECYFTYRVGRANDATHHELYSTWSNIRTRIKDNPNYAGREIKLHPAWENSFTFLTHIENELGPRPPGMTLDRIDNDGNYEPGNLRWATKETQVHNRRSYRGTRAQDCGWVASLIREKTKYYLGWYRDEEEAHQIYVKALEAYNAGGLDALTNFAKTIDFKKRKN